MIRALALVLGLVFAAPLAAQQTSTGPGAVLRVLDKVSGQAVDMQLAAGRSGSFGRLTIMLRECRYPAGNPSGNAYAALEISEKDRAKVAFSGWMIASAPALSAMDHPRYDVWVMRCTTS